MSSAMWPEPVALERKCLKGRSCLICKVSASGFGGFWVRA